MFLTVGVAILSLMESPYVPPSLSTQDKLLHGAMYAVLAIAWIVPLRRHRGARLAPYVWTWLAVVGYGALMECLQRFCTLTRSGEMADLYADAIGAAVGLLIIGLLGLFRHKH